jgi:hypothetical protein
MSKNFEFKKTFPLHVVAMPVPPALRKWRQEGKEFKVNLR